VKSTSESEQKSQQSPTFVGPPNPAMAYGPEPELRQEVVVIIGPGMASALSGAGVIRALQDQKIAIAAIGGVEFGAMISAAYAIAGSANKMDWSLLQFQADWVRPREGLSRVLSRAPRSSRPLSQGLDKIFQDRSVDTLKVPLWAFGSKGDLLHSWPSGSVSSAVCNALSSVSWIEPCVTSPSHPGQQVSGQLRDQWERSGLRLPVVWVVPARLESRPEDASAQALGGEIRAFLKQVEASRSDQDLVVAPRPVVADYFDFGRRSEVVYSGKQEARKQFEQWMSRLGWTRKKRSP
jgi:predicted acylesterase/phospholipase RssA